MEDFKDFTEGQKENEIVKTGCEAEKKEKILLEKHNISKNDVVSGGEYFTTFSEDQKTVFLYKLVDSL